MGLLKIFPRFEFSNARPGYLNREKYSAFYSLQPGVADISR
jgi:hypothetical protein